MVTTQLPDLIDKPLTTWTGVLPSGRSLGHSLLFVFVVGMIVWLFARRSAQADVTVAAIVGLLSHVIADAIDPLLGGRWAELGHLLWPLTPAYDYPAGEDRVFSEFLFIQLVSAPHHELVLFGTAVLLWIYDGMPGVAEIRTRIT